MFYGLGMVVLQCAHGAHIEVVKALRGNVLSGFLFLHKHHDQESSWGRKGLLSLHFHTAVRH